MLQNQAANDEFIRRCSDERRAGAQSLAREQAMGCDFESTGSRRTNLCDGILCGGAGLMSSPFERGLPRSPAHGMVVDLDRFRISMPPTYKLKP